ncbi:hypothetical protein [Xanthomonas sp. WHRI 7945]|nr:hypothetical protein [Xanthomonas campestris pv. campestris]
MAAVIEFPAARIVRSLRKRVARPRKLPAAVDPASQRRNRIAELLVERALKGGQTLAEIARRLHEKNNSTDDQAMQKIHAAVKAELHRRMGAASVTPMSIRFAPQWPAGKRGEKLEELAQLAFNSCVRRGGTNTLEDARKFVLELVEGLKNRGKLGKEASP